MPIKGNFYIPPIDYSSVTGRKWQITGFNIASAHPEAIFLDHTTGLAHALFSGAIEGGNGYYNTGAIDIYSASGQYNSRDLTVSWGVVNPVNKLEISSDDALAGGYLQGFEVNFYDETGKFFSGINFEDDGSIQKVDLLAGGSGYLNPTVIVTGVYEGGAYQDPSGTGAYIKLKTLGSGLHKSGDILSIPESGLGYLSGIYHVDVVSGGSGYTQDTVLLITGSGGPGGAGIGSGANLKINPLGLGKRYGYSSATNLTIPYFLNKDVFGGEAKRKYQIEVIAVDYYNQRTTGRLMVDFPKPRLGDVVLKSISDEISFNINPPTETFGGKTFEDISLQDIAIYRDDAEDFEINNEIGKSNFLTRVSIPQSNNGEGRLENFSSIDIPKKFFNADDAFRGYFYKFLPIDNFGTGNPVSYATGVRPSEIDQSPESPSGIKLIVDPAKTVGTNVEGETITNTYITWKKDRQFRANNYEVVLDDNVENESYILTCTTPSISGIDYLVSGTGSSIATNDQDLLVPLPAPMFPRTMFDIFKPYGAAGVSWSDHTIFLDEKSLPKLSTSFDNVRELNVKAGNTASGYVYFSGSEGYTTTYVADNRLLENQGVALLARNVKGEILTEYEPRIKIPTKKDGQYSIKVKSYALDYNTPSLYSKTVEFTASGNSSHFTFAPAQAQLRLGGTGDITVNGDFATTVGGSGIVANGKGIVVVGGVENRATGEVAALVGGSGNRLIGNIGDPQEGHFLGGGALNTGSGQYTAMVGGFRNSAQAHGAFLGGGIRNYIPHDVAGNDASVGTAYSLIGGGLDNTVSGLASIIVGGNTNKIGTNAAIGETTATRFVNDGINDSSYSTIVGGQNNEIYAPNSFIGGGLNNIIFGASFADKSNILGGSFNIVSGVSSTDGSAILAGTRNKLINAGTALAGGSYSSGTADNTFAFGVHSWAAHEGAFVLSDSTIPSATADGTIAKKSHGANTLNLFFDNGIYVRNGDVFISGDLTVSGSSSVGGSAGAVSAVANGADNRVATFSSSDALNGEANLTFDGTNLTVGGDAGVTGEFRVNRSGLFVGGDSNANAIVGIGTKSPQFTLDVHGVASIGGITTPTTSSNLNVLSLASIRYSAATATSKRLDFQAGNTQNLIQAVTNPLYFYDSTAVRMALLQGGNVGIGTALPSGRLHVNNAGTGIIVANETITGNAFEVFGAQGNLLTVTDDLSDSLFSVNDAAGMPVFEVFADDTIKSYRNNEIKFEIDPDNNRIRLRDNTFISGNTTISGQAAIGSSPSIFTAGGTTQVSIQVDNNEVPLSMGASDTDLIYFRRQAAGQMQIQTYNSANAGLISLQPYGGSVAIGGGSAASSGVIFSVSSPAETEDTKFDIDPANNRIQLRDNTYV